MNYSEVIDYLFNSFPVYEKVGGYAYKPGLTNITALCELLNHPQHTFKSVHIAGTNGKGSCSHMLASVLAAAGYKTGLFTSPHLKSFTERIRVNGEAIQEDYIVAFVNKYKNDFDIIKPSFFEMTTAMAFQYFADQKVDIAIMETGMGGRLDATNILNPEVCLITNISYDHQAYLGNTLALIAGEKAGIIKPETPIVISEKQEEVLHVFENKAGQLNASLIKAFDQFQVISSTLQQDGQELIIQDQHRKTQKYFSDLRGSYQKKNIPAVLSVVEVLKQKDFSIAPEAVHQGLSQVIKTTGFKGRWQVLAQSPLIVCDTAHNAAGLKEVMENIQRYSYHHLYIILGMANDKQVDEVLAMLPKEAFYYFCQANTNRAMKAEDLLEIAASKGLKGKVIHDVNQALVEVCLQAMPEDFIFIGGSNFVIAELDLL